MDDTCNMSLTTLKSALAVTTESIQMAQCRVFLQNNKAVEDLDRALAYLRIVSGEAEKLESLVYQKEDAND